MIALIPPIATPSRKDKKNKTSSNLDESTTTPLTTQEIDALDELGYSERCAVEMGPLLSRAALRDKEPARFEVRLLNEKTGDWEGKRLGTVYTYLSQADFVKAFYPHFSEKLDAVLEMRVLMPRSQNKTLAEKTLFRVPVNHPERSRLRAEQFPLQELGRAAE